MTNLKDKIKKLSIGAKISLASLGLATFAGTFGGNEGGLPLVYNKKAGTWGGINIGVYTEFQPESKFYGISLSFFSNTKDYIQKSEFYGALIGLGNGADHLTGTQIGVANGADHLTGVQMGMVNHNQNHIRSGLGVLLSFANSEVKK